MVSAQILTNQEVNDIFRATGTEEIFGVYRSYYIWFNDLNNQTSYRLKLYEDCPNDNEFHIVEYENSSTGRDIMSHFVKWSEESQAFVKQGPPTLRIPDYHIPLSWRL
jgi:hypothetical protein